MQVQSLGWEDPLEEENGNPLQYSWLKKSHGQRSLAGYSLWGYKESDTTEWLNNNNLESISLQGELRKYLSLSDNMEIIFVLVVKEFLDVINF